MKTQFAKIAIAALGLAITLFLSCTDNQPLDFPSLEEVRQKLSSSEPSSSSGASNLCAEEDKCNGVCYNRETQFCDDKIYDKCSGNSYDVPSQICCGDALYPKSSYGCCNETSYLLLNYGCKENNILNKCGISLYDPEKQFCASDNEVYVLCGGKQFDPDEQFCVGGVIQGTCGGKIIDFNSFFCHGGESHKLCGSKSYDPTKKFCSGTTLYDKCNDKEYDPSTSFCYAEEPYLLCGGYDYNPTDQFCYNNSIKGKCGGTLEYDPAKEYCHTDGKTYSCDNKPYNPSIYYCHTDGKTYSCGNKPYNPATHFCNTAEGKLYSCGNKPYNPATHFCDETTGQTHTCNNKPYNPATQFCYSGNRVGNFCGINPQKSYDPDLYECKPPSNGIYLKGGLKDNDNNNYDAVLIGTQVWMAKNLKYNVTDSRCKQNNENYNNATVSENTPICDTYGRLYSWEMVMGGELDSDANPSGVKGICPQGWHLPSIVEWETLINYVGDYAETRLKATSGWQSSNGTDDYGFTALMSGKLIGRNNTYLEPGGSYWWTTTIVSSSWNRIPANWHIDDHGISNGVLDADRVLFYVRCVKNN